MTTSKTERSTNLIIIHLKAFIADNLEPMNDRFGASKGIEVRIRGQLLMLTNVFARPVEEYPESYVDYSNEDRRVEDCLPHCC
jgi:hypothetical protein